MPRIPPNEIDRLIGRRIRERRRSLGISQKTLAAHLGISHQQIQKYESGRDKIAASTLFEIAHQMQVTVGWFLANDVRLLP